MAVKIVIRPHPKSHPFSERECYINPQEQVKVGRSVAKIKAASDNFIFDCKVLSRNHAVIWLEDGQFYIKDTKSSNGTFVNSHRLSRTGEESAPVPLRDGDIVQFGVDVTENQNRAVTHGCIITTFHCDLDQKKSGSIVQDPMVEVSARTLDELARILIETKQHQEVLEVKLAAVQGDVLETKSDTQHAFKSFMDEDELLSRIEMLENQLQFYTQDMPDDSLRKQLNGEEDKRHQEGMKAKDNVRRVLQEKLDLSCQLSDVKRECYSYQQEAERLTSLYEESKKEMNMLQEKQRQRLSEMEELKTQLNSMEERHSVLENKSTEERSTLSTQLAGLREDIDKLTEERDHLSGENEAYKESQQTIYDQNIELRQDIASLRLKLEAQVQPAVLAAKQSDEEDTALQERLTELEGKLAAAQAKSDELSQQLAAAEDVTRTVQATANERLNALTELQREVSEKTALAASLESQIKLASPFPAPQQIPVNGADDSNDMKRRSPSLFDEGPGAPLFNPSETSSPSPVVPSSRSDPEINHGSPGEASSSSSLKDMRMYMAMRGNHSSPAQYVAMRQNLTDSRKFISRLQHENKDLLVENKQLQADLAERSSAHSHEQNSLQQRFTTSTENCRHLQTLVENQAAELRQLRQTAVDREEMLRQRQGLQFESSSELPSYSKTLADRSVMNPRRLFIFGVAVFTLGFLMAYLLAC